MSNNHEKQRCVLQAKNISKSFGPIKANHNISIQLMRGQIISILGENGAGKSTLMNILYGLYQPDEGKIFIDGKERSFRSPREAIRCGLGMVHQHFMLIETLTVTQNIILGEEPHGWGGINYKRARQEVLTLSKLYHLEIDPDVLVGDLPVALQQRVEILKTLYRKAKILILDEPTAVLTPQDIDDFFAVLRHLQDEGVSVIIISHKLEEIKVLSSRVYILRRGLISAEFDTQKVTIPELAKHMVGREVKLSQDYTRRGKAHKKILQVQEITVSNSRRLAVLRSLSLEIKKGEIVGIAGVDGNGQEELAEVLMGLRPLRGGNICYKGRDIAGLSVRERIAQGMAYVPADRHNAGLVLPFSLAENNLLGNEYKPELSSYGLIQRKSLAVRTQAAIRNFAIQCSGSEDLVARLSGGNQQKVILAREFDRHPDFLLVSQPTRGLDVGAIEYIHQKIIDMRNRGVGILLISLELDEILTLSDRVLVLFEGQIRREFSREEATRDKIGFYMAGAKKRAEEESIGF